MSDDWGKKRARWRKRARGRSRRSVCFSYVRDKNPDDKTRVRGIKMRGWHGLSSCCFLSGCATKSMQPGQLTHSMDMLFFCLYFHNKKECIAVTNPSSKKAERIGFVAILHRRIRKMPLALGFGGVPRPYVLRVHGRHPLSFFLDDVF